jgi:hypothetical protein
MLTKKASPTLFLSVSPMNPQLNSTPGNTQLPSGLSSITHTDEHLHNRQSQIGNDYEQNYRWKHIVQKGKAFISHNGVNKGYHHNNKAQTNYSTLLQPSENCHRNSQGKQGNLCFIQLHIHTMPSLPDFFL